MEVHRLNNPPLRLLRQHDSKLLLCSPVRGDCCLGAYDVMPHKVVAVHRDRDVCLCQEHEAITISIDGPTCLGESKPTSVPNVVRTQVDSHGAGRLALTWRRRRVQAVTGMPYRPGETYGHITHLTLIPLEVPMKMCRTTYRIIYYRIRSFCSIQ